MRRLIAAILMLFGLGGGLAACQSGGGESSVGNALMFKSTFKKAPPSRWTPFERDLIHSTEGVAYDLLQRPQEAFSEMPEAKGGNQIDWVKAARDGYIEPWSVLYDDTADQRLDLDVYFNPFGYMAAVKFPHDIHTEWLGCNSCHDKLFKQEIGETGVTMTSILNGKHCGYCHGKVAFPLTQCLKCHNTPFEQFRRVLVEHQKKTGEGMRIGSGKRKFIDLDKKGRK